MLNLAGAMRRFLIDASMAENVQLIQDSIRKLGFRVEDVRIILNSHAHFDHAGGIAAMACATGAEVFASEASRKALRLGGDDANDPQHGSAAVFAAVPEVSQLVDGQQVPLAAHTLVAYLTPGHTPGSTTWAWRSCENEQCLSIV